MMLTKEQMRTIRMLSDTQLYREAIAFLDAEVNVKREVQKRTPLPNTQMNGLLNVTQANTYGDLRAFVEHQKKRNWQGDKEAIGDFYRDLEPLLKEMGERVKTEGLVTPGLGTEQTNKELEKLRGILVREFIQHLAAENGVRERERKEQEKRAKEQKRLGYHD